MSSQLSLLLLEAALKWGPGLARDISNLFSKEVITKADWDALFDKMEKSYEEYVAPKS